MIPQDQLRYPIGRFVKAETYNLTEIKSNLQQFAQLPNEINAVISHLDKDDQQKTYRQGGWNIRQLVNHLVDSHINSYVRFKWATTEDTPVIKPYAENEWATTSDYDQVSLKDCVTLLQLIHQRIVGLALDWKIEDWEKTFYHPGRKEVMTLSQNIALYHWHGRHHLEHIKLAISK